MEVANLFGDEWQELPGPRPESYTSNWLHVGARIGASRIGGSLYELPPGNRTFPYHYEYGQEEWLICVQGAPTLRTPDGERELRAGDTVCFPEGPDGAHQVINRSDAPARVLILSTKTLPRVVVYPDSDKLALLTGNADDRLIVRRESGVDYWDGEA